MLKAVMMRTAFLRHSWVSLGVWGAAFVSAIQACAQYQVYWGDVHGHTSFSDGKGTLDDYFTQARDIARLDFVIVTDHDFGNGRPDWHLPKENWTLTQEKADQHTVNGRFVGIAGYEWTSQEKYWAGFTNGPSERLFPGPPRHYNHKNVYFPGRVDYLFSSKNKRFNAPDLLAAAVRKQGGLIHNNHPSADLEGRDQFTYAPSNFDVIVNTEMLPDTIRYEGKTHPMQGEQTVRAFLNHGGRTGFVAGSDTHDGKLAARTAVLATALTRDAIFDALRHRRNYAVWHARIGLDFRIDGHVMGGVITVKGAPRIQVKVTGTDRIEEIAIIRDGVILHLVKPGGREAQFQYVDHAFAGSSYYYVRVIQSDKDSHGNNSQAWSSPIWVNRQP